MTWALFWEWLIKSLILVFGLLGGFAYTTLYERRLIARFQVRVGPNRAGPQGILQPIADAVKLIFKEELTPAKVYKLIFFLAPVLTMVPSLIIAAVIPWGTFVHAGRAHDPPVPGGPQCGCDLSDVHRFDCGVRHCAGGLVEQ